MTVMDHAERIQGYVVDPDDPRAPPTEVWNAMTAAERFRVVDELPSDFTLDFLPPPEGDRHLIPKVTAIDTLGRHFRRSGRSVYVSGELPLYYPGERVFSADLVAVLDVEVRERDRWVVDLEGQGIDFALEIHVRGSRKKDMIKNVERYARLGIPEYFVFDRARGDLHGFRLRSPESREYEKLDSRQGRLESKVLEMDLALLGGKLRFLLNDAEIPEAEELISRLGKTLDQVITTKHEAELRAEELERDLAAETERREEEQKRREEEQRRREELERQLSEAHAELERLRRSG
ncbi:MAG: Uma2 family endonuclease [Polyangiaceae bacterium]